MVTTYPPGAGSTIAAGESLDGLGFALFVGNCRVATFYSKQLMGLLEKTHFAEANHKV